MECGCLAGLTDEGSRLTREPGKCRVRGHGVTGSLGRRRDQGEQDLSSTFFRLPTGGNHAGSPKREMVRVRRATAGTKLAIVVMSALLLRLRCEPDP